MSAALLLTGLSLCLASAFGLTRALCLTGGCQLYQGYSFLGLSLHIWGALAFGTGLVLLLYRPGDYRRFLYLCLWAEIVLLAYQLVYLPCSECLLVGLIWGLLALMEMRERVSVKIWSVVFLAALVLMGQDLVHPWPVYGHTDAPVKVYFSPSCPGCQKEIEKVLAGGEVDRGKLAFFPVALKADDIKGVYSFQNVLNRTLNLNQAFRACWSKEVQLPASWRNWLMIKFGLIRNRMILARMGVQKIPVVVSGSLASLSGAPAGECGFVEGKDCPDKIVETHKVIRPAQSKVASLKKFQFLAGDSPETAEIVPQALAPSADTTDTAETSEQPVQAIEQEAQAPEIKVFTQEKLPEPVEDIDEGGDEEMVKQYFRSSPDE